MTTETPAAVTETWEDRNAREHREALARAEALIARGTEIAQGMTAGSGQQWTAHRVEPRHPEYPNSSFPSLEIRNGDLVVDVDLAEGYHHRNARGKLHVHGSYPAKWYGNLESGEYPPKGIYIDAKKDDYKIGLEIARRYVGELATRYDKARTGIEKRTDRKAQTLVVAKRIAALVGDSFDEERQRRNGGEYFTVYSSRAIGVHEITVHGEDAVYFRVGTNAANAEKLLKLASSFTFKD